MAFLAKHWFLVGLAAALLIGGNCWQWLAPLNRVAWLPSAIVTTVLFLMALSLRAEAMWRVVRRPGGALLASAINLGLLPLVAVGLSRMLDAHSGAGLIVAAAAPCTLASAAVWTRRGGGNDALAMMVTVITNLACVVLTPAWLLCLDGPDIKISWSDTVVRLAVLVMLPMVIGQLARMARPIAAWSDERKPLLSTLAQCGILAMVLLGSIRTGQRLSGATGDTWIWWDGAAMLVAVMLLHSSMLACGFWLARWLRMTREDGIAIAIAGSQKTLMIGLWVAVQLDASMIPMVAYHAFQLFLDTLLVNRFARKARDRGADSS